MISTHCTHTTLQSHPSFLLELISHPSFVCYINFILMSLLTSLVVLIWCEHLNFVVVSCSCFIFKFFFSFILFLLQLQLFFHVLSTTDADGNGPNVHRTLVCILPYCFVSQICAVRCHLWYLLGFS